MSRSWAKRMGVTASSAEGTAFAKAQMGVTAGYGECQELQAVWCCRSLNRRVRNGGNTLAGATGQEQIAGDFQRRPWTSSYGRWRTLADIKPCKDAIRQRFRKITPVVVRRMSLSGDRSQGDQEKGTSQPAGRCCYRSLLTGNADRQILRRQAEQTWGLPRYTGQKGEELYMT